MLAARENAAANGATVDVRHLDMRTQPLPWPVPVVVLANLLRPLLLDLAERFPAAPRHLLAAGLLAGEADELAGAFARTLGMRERTRRERGEWAALWLTSA